MSGEQRRWKPSWLMRLAKQRGAILKVRVFFHDKCFDGTASAALFARLYSERIRDNTSFEYLGLLHRAGSLFDEKDFTGDENAIVDFKYSASPKITWWFDHHQSAFLSPEDAKHFEEHPSPRKMFDISYKSCTRYIRDIACQKWGFSALDLEDLVEWATVID
jgi:hypothetical protein